MEPDLLKDKMLEIIGEYNGNPVHRKIKTAKFFGEEDKGGINYSAQWDDDIGSSHFIGFIYRDNKIIKKGKEISPKEALKEFKEKIKRIPKKQ